MIIVNNMGGNDHCYAALQNAIIKKLIKTLLDRSERWQIFIERLGTAEEHEVEQLLLDELSSCAADREQDLKLFGAIGE